MNDIMDWSFEYHLALTRVWGELTRNLADSLILPLKGSEYGFKMRRSLDALKNQYETQIEDKGLSFGKSMMKCSIEEKEPFLNYLV